MMAKTKKEIYKILHTAHKDISELVFDKKGNYKKGLNSLQRKEAHRVKFLLLRIMSKMNKGVYRKDNFDADL